MKNDPVIVSEDEQLISALQESIHEIREKVPSEDSDEPVEAPEEYEPAHDEEEEEYNQYRDFRFADVFAAIEDSINNNRGKFKCKQLKTNVKEAVMGTKLEFLVRRGIY